MLTNPATRDLVNAMRSLLDQLLSIQPCNSYSHARLLRLVDQTEYFVLAWPDKHWPNFTPAGDAIQDKKQVLAWLGQARHLLDTLPTSLVAYNASTWQQARSLLLRALQQVTPARPLY